MYKMSGHWKNLQEAADGFRDILNKNLTKLVVADFRLKLSRSIQENTTFKNDMLKCGALVHWTDEILLKWVITKETISESLTAIETLCNKKESTTVNRKTRPNSRLDIKLILEQLQLEIAIDDSEKALPLIKSAYEPDDAPKTKVNKTQAKNYSASSEDDSMIIPETKIVCGKSMGIFTPENYIKIQEIIPRPQLDYKEKNPIHSSIAFLVQKIKMWGCNALTCEKLAELFITNAIEIKGEKSNNFMQLIQNITDTSSSTKSPENVNLSPLCKLDIFSYLTTVTEITVLAEMFRVLSKFPQTLPLILPNLNSEGNATHILMSPVLQKCLIRWEVADRLVENYLFLSPFKLITAIRLGTHRTGKSTFLNQLFESSNTFQCRGQPGGQRGAPIAVTSGSVEFIWLIETTCRSSTWTAIQNAQTNLDKSEIVLLANLHGDALDHLDLLKAISPMTSQLLVFVMPDAVKDISVSGRTIATICGHENISLLFVDPPEGIQPPDASTLKAVEILHDETLQKLNKFIKDAVESTKSISGFQPKIREKSVKIIDRVETPESEEFIKFVKEINEKLKSKNDSLRGILCLQKNITMTNSDDENWKLWDSSPNLQKIMSSFVKIMKLPLKSRRLALGHVEQELALLMAIQTEKHSKQLNELIQIKNSYKMDSNYNPTSDFSLPQIKDEIEKLYAELGKSLGLEDVLRELGFVYELMTSKSIDLPIYSDLPEYYAELLIEGMTLEILDGDLGVISRNWLESVCHSVCKKMPKLKVYVLSILGLQSSGKSTLLNALFGCKFAVSVGKCTRGLFMRLMVLEKSYRKKLKIDAILIVDTEGLGAPENMTAADSKLKDRRMATFAMAISNLTLVNVLGEAKNEVANIMQIVILTIARMDESDLAPDILLVQHVAEGGQEFKIKEGVSQFCTALDEAVSIAKTQILNLGVKTLNNLKNIKARVQNQELLAQIRPFKSGASPQSPPTEGYHEDVMRLRNQIMAELTRKSNSQSFCTWHKLLKSYWNAVQTHNFALQFINIREVHEYIDVTARISSVKRRLDSAFLSHQKNLHDRFIKEKIASLNPQKGFMSSKTFDDEVIQEIKAIFESLPANCQGLLTTELTKCKRCQLANDKRKELLAIVKQTSSISLTETEENLESHILELQKSNIARMLRVLESEKIKAGKASEFENMLAEIIKSSQSSMQSKSADIIWEDLLIKVQTRYPIINIRQRIFDDILKLYKQAPDIHLWKQALDHVPLTKDDPQPTLQTLAVKKKALFPNKNRNLTATEHNWLCENMAQITQQVILKRKNTQQSYYSHVMLEQHQGMAATVLNNFMKHFKISLDDRYRWEAILYSLQLLAFELIQFQNLWNELNEPYYILLSEKKEYLKKIDIYLELQRRHTNNVNLSKTASTLAEKLLKAAVVVTINSWGAQSHFSKWTLEPKSVRLAYLLALVEHIKSGNVDLALENFRNPRQIITEWYTTSSENFVRYRLVPILKKMFMEENAAVITEIQKTKNAQELNKFVAWYLVKMKESVSDSEVVTEEMFKNIKEQITKELERRAEEYREKICLESIPLDNDSFSNSIGCTITCPKCSALCWGHKGHEHNTVRYKNHFTCHQPMGLAGVVDSSGSLVLRSCSDEGVDEDQLTSNQPTKEDKEAEVPWVKTKHVVDEYAPLMQWFIFKLNHSLAEFYQVNPASDEAMKALGFHTIDAQLDKILNFIRHRTAM